MKKNLPLKLIFSFLFSVFLIISCRNDGFFRNTEQTKNILLSSKIISLKESKHINKILPELTQAKQILNEAQQKGNFGKTKTYGDSITINTDRVILVENGLNYHTYTFNIERTNSLPNSPVENLILTPLPDGSYMEILATYNFTEQEKEQIRLGNGVNTKGKVTFVELKKGTFNVNGMLISKGQSCGWIEETIWVGCSHVVNGVSEHNQSNWQEWGNCTAATPPRVYTVVRYKCESVDDGSGNGGGSTLGEWEGGGDSLGTGDGNGGGSGEGTSDCSGTGVYTHPIDPTISTDTGCDDGVPTIINVDPKPKTPCEKNKNSILKATNTLKNSQVKSNVDDVLRVKTQSPLEYAKKIGRNTDGTYSFSQLVEGTKDMTSLTNVTLPSGNYVGDGHSHAGGYGDPSAGDFYGMLEQIALNSNFETRFVYGDYFGTSEVYALVLNDRTQALDFLANYPRASNYDTSSRSFLKGSVIGDEFWKANDLHHKGASVDSSGENYISPAIGMAYILDKYNVGISLAKADADGNLKRINATLEEIEVPLSGGVRKQGVKITKCP